MADNNTIIVNAPIVASWKSRRAYMYVVSLFAMVISSLTVYNGADTEVAMIVVQSSYWLLFGITLLYVFGVTIQDIVALKTGFGYGSNATTKVNTDTNNSGVQLPVGESQTNSSPSTNVNVSVGGKPL